jgi:hypothetical protein
MAVWQDLLPKASRGLPVQPEVDLPAGFVGVRGKRKVAEGERRLRLAVLEDAIACLQKHASARAHHRRRLFEEAEEWIMETGGGSTFSFEGVCEVLGLDPGYLRVGLRRWCDRQSARSGARQAWGQRRCRPGTAAARQRQSTAAEFLERCLKGLRCAPHEGIAQGG